MAASPILRYIGVGHPQGPEMDVYRLNFGNSKDLASRRHKRRYLWNGMAGRLPCRHISRNPFTPVMIWRLSIHHVFPTRVISQGFASFCYAVVKMGYPIHAGLLLLAIF